MSKFIWKPEVVDFGHEPTTKYIKFIHEGTNITIEDYPAWLSDVSVDFTPSSGDVEKGKITATVSYDATRHQESGLIQVYCDSEAYLIPVVYQYDSEHLPIMDVIDSVFMNAGEESYINPQHHRQQAILAAKRWIQDNGGVTGTNLRYAELDVVENKVYLPADFVDYVGVFIVSSDGYLTPLYVNNEINIGQEVLQDENYFHLLDDGGFVIGAYGLTSRVDNETPYTYKGVDLGALSTSQKVYNIRPGKLSFNGMYKYDRANRVIVLDGMNVDKVVLEYISDPIKRHRLKMDMGEIKVHQRWMEALELWIYYKLIQVNRFVPQNEKARALRDYKLAVKRANMRQISIHEMVQVLKGSL